MRPHCIEFGGEMSVICSFRLLTKGGINMQWPCIITAMVTPFTEDGVLDEARAESLAGWLVANGSEGLVVAGTTGESPTLSRSERERLYYAVRRGAGNAMVLMGTGSNDTHHAVEMSQEAARWGADGVLVVTPYYNKPPQEGLFQHFVKIAENLSAPVMLYNVPGRTGVTLAADTVARIAKACPNVVAVKEATGQIESIERLLEICPGMMVYSGDDALFYPALTLGAHGVVSVAAHVVGPEMAALVQAFRSGDITAARGLHGRLLPIFRDLFSWPNPIPLKWLMNQLNMNVGPVRLPLVYPQDTSTLERLKVNVEDLRREKIARHAS